MSQGETVISILLLVIIFFLYQIAKQLSYLTGRKIRISLFNWQQQYLSFPHKKSKKQPPKNLPN